jgi:TrmH family RNA methyltransferase
VLQRISSRQNPIVRYFRNVASGRIPDRILLDGDHLIDEALTSGVTIEVSAFTDPVAADKFEGRVGSATSILIVTSAVLKALSPVQSPSGSVALAARPETDLDRVFARSPQLILLLHDVQDPGNVGAIVRAAEGCGATGVICSERTADPFSWKALRGSMGSSLRVPLAVKHPLASAIAMARGKGVRIFATDASGGTPLPECNLRVPAVIVLGGEGAGLPVSVIEIADERLTIPMQPPVESLNVATAAALVIYEAARQRHRDRVHVTV